MEPHRALGLHRSREQGVTLAATTAGKKPSPVAPRGGLWEAALIAAVYEVVIGLPSSFNN